MTVDIMDKLKEYGWYITEQGYNSASDAGRVTDVQKVIKRLLDIDLREVGSGLGDVAQGNIVLQIQKVRNVAAPKNNEESRSAPRMLKLSLTDGKNNYQAVEIDHIGSLGLNTPPGTKIFVKPGSVHMAHGMILLTSSFMIQILGGKVATMIEKWELNKRLAQHTRIRSTDEGGPPPWIPFGKKIIKVTDQDKNFKALSEKDKATKENVEFEAQRKDAIAEAAKQGSKKIFGGGNKQLLDHSVQRIVDQGFSVDQAEYALRVNRNNIERALRSLQKSDIRNNAGREPRDSREPREPRNKRFDKKSEESKPSTGKISLFDFLEDKLPAASESVDTGHAAQTNYALGAENSYEKVDFRSSDTHAMKGGRSQRGGRAYQAPPRHQDESRNSKRPNSNSSGPNQFQQFNGVNPPSKPPRFQRNQDTNSYYQMEGFGKTYPKSQFDFRNQNAQSRTDGGNANTGGQFQRNQDYQGKMSGHNKAYSYFDGDTRNKNDYDTPHGRHNRPQKDGAYKGFPANSNDQNYKSQMNRFPSNENSGRGAIGFNRNRSEQQYSNNQNANNSQAGGTWVWRIGDKCLAKYWEDNRYYSAEVTDVSDRTCVVQFKGFENYEEVLQIDCIPYTDDQIVEKAVNSRRPDQRYNNKQQQQFDQGHSHINVGMEFRRGGNMSANKGFGKKRTQQRSTQPIYQPPAQRSQSSMSMNA